MEPPVSVPSASGASQAATAAAEPPLEPPGIRSQSHGLRVEWYAAVLGGRAHCEFVAVGLAQEHGVGLFEPRNDVGIVGRHEILKHLAPAGCPLAADRKHVLDSYWNAGQRTKLASCAAACAFDRWLLSLLQGFRLSSTSRKRFDPAVTLADGLEELAGQMFGGRFALLEEGQQALSCRTFD